MIWRLFPPTQRTSANTCARRHSLDNPPEWAIRPGTGLARPDDWSQTGCQVRTSGKAQDPRP